MNEASLIQRIRAGDHDAYGQLVDRYYRGLLNHLYHMTKQVDLAEDLTQEAFVKAFYKLDSYNDQYRFSTWLYRIGTNEALKALRSKSTITLDDVPELPGTYDAQASLQAEQREAEVRRAVARLPLKYQTVISLYYWQKLPYDEIATIMSVPLGTVKTWLSRAKAQLRQDLGGEL